MIINNRNDEIVQINDEKINNMGIYTIQELLNEMKCSKCREILRYVDISVSVSCNLQQKLHTFKTDSDSQVHIFYSLITHDLNEKSVIDKIDKICCSKCKQDLTERQLELYKRINKYYLA